MIHCFAGQQQLYDCVTSHLVTTCPNPVIPAAVRGQLEGENYSNWTVTKCT